MSGSARPWTAARQAPLSSISQNLLRFILMESMMLSDLILCCRLLLPPSIFPIIRVFSNESALCTRWPKYWSKEHNLTSDQWNPERINLYCFRQLCLWKFVTCAVLCLVPQSCPTLCDPMDRSLPSISVLGDSPGRNTGGGCHALLQGVFPTQGWNPGLLHCGQILYHLSHQGSARILDRVSSPFSRGW